MGWLRKRHGLSQEAQLAWSAVGSVGTLIDTLVQRILADTAGALHGVREPADFEALCRRVRTGIGGVANAIAGQLNELLPLYGTLKSGLEKQARRRWPQAVEDLDSQSDDLIYPEFLVELGPGRLEQLPRYFRSMNERLTLLEQNPSRDRERLERVRPWWDRYQHALERGCVYDEPLDDYRWLLHEYRVSVFTQRLGTAVKVSEKRLAQAWRATGC
jgi:ATP-dependent helicase HrpA